MKKLENLDQLIGVYFNQDFYIDYINEEKAIREYVKYNSNFVLCKICLEIDIIIKDTKTEENLKKILVDIYDLGIIPTVPGNEKNIYTAFLQYIRNYICDYLQSGGMKRLEMIRYSLSQTFDANIKEGANNKEYSVKEIIGSQPEQLTELCSEIDTLIKETKTEENLKKELLEIYYLDFTPQIPGIDFNSYTELLLYIKNHVMNYLERGGKDRLCYLFRLLSGFLHLNFKDSHTDKQFAVQEFIESSKVHEIEKLNNEIETLLQKVDNEAQLVKILTDIYFVKVPPQSPRIKLHSYTHLLLYIKNHVWDYLQKGGKDRLDLLYFVFRREFNSIIIGRNFDKQKALQITINRSKDDDLFELTCEIEYLLKQTESEAQLEKVLRDVYFVELSPHAPGVELNSYTELLQYMRNEVREHLKTIGYNLLQENKFHSKY